MPVQIDSGNPDFDKLLARIADIHRAKNHDYSNPEKKDFYSNFRECAGFGIAPWRGILIRMSDKWSRIKRLSSKEAAVKTETLDDTLIDLAVYSLLCILVMNEWNDESRTENSEGTPSGTWDGIGVRPAQA